MLFSAAGNETGPHGNKTAQNSLTTAGEGLDNSSGIGNETVINNLNQTSNSLQNDLDLNNTQAAKTEENTPNVLESTPVNTT